MPTCQANLVFGIAGGSGSGKTTIACALMEHFGPEEVQLLVIDSYYKDHPEMPFEERARVNYDHPEAFDVELLVSHIRALREGRSIASPVYDYVEHRRSGETRPINPAPVLIVEGILALALEPVRRLLGSRIYVDTPPDIRFIRRLRRDTVERGRTMDSVIRQYEQTVRPMHLAFVEPSKVFADVIFPEGANDNAQRMLSAWIHEYLRSVRELAQALT